MRNLNKQYTMDDGRWACRPLAATVLCALTLSALPLSPAAAQQHAVDSTRATSHMLTIGSAEVLDTYLSPEKYEGTEVRYIWQSLSPTRWRHVSRTVTHEGQLTTVHNRADNNDELGGAYRLRYILRRDWRLTSGLTLSAGGGLDAMAGFLYNMRNTNNPAQARVALHLTPSVAATYDFSWRAACFQLAYEASAPLVGLMFSPNYGQSYYEIFNEDDNDHNIVPTTIGTTPSLRHQLTLDFRPARKWRRTWLRIGYLGDYQQARINNLRYHQYSHLFILGITKKW